MNRPIKYQCPKCESDNIHARMLGNWNVRKQEWENFEIIDLDCIDCNYDDLNNPDWQVQITDAEKVASELKNRQEEGK